MNIATKPERLVNISPVYLINCCIALALMIGFKFIPASAPLTPMGMSVIGIFLGMLYGWLVVGDFFWPSIAALVFLGLSGYMKISEAFTAGFGNSTVLLILFFFAFTNIIDNAGLTEYIAVWMTSRKFIQGRPYVLTLMVLLAIVVLSMMITMSAAVLVLFPIIKRISEVYGIKPGESWPIHMFVGVAFVGSTAYMLLPFKPLQAAVFANYQAISGTTIPYSPYFLIVVAMTIGAIIGTLALMKFVFKTDVSKIVNSKNALLESPPLTGYQKFIIGYFILVVFCMLFPTIAPKTWDITKTLNNIGNTGIMAISVVLWAAMKIVSRPTIPQLFSKNVTWSILFILAAALTIAGAISSKQTGISAWLVLVLTPIVSGKSAIVFVCLIALISCVLTNFANNIPTAALLTPIIYAIGTAVGLNDQAMVICMLFAANIGLITPPASTPAAIIHGDSEWVPGITAYKLGLTFSLYNVVLILLICYPLGGLLF
ncbi:SLC13 family permease [Pelotomaculum propionicicum]|uniref:Sodium-dependent dicarboxylate transporter SdcS n=1 Tax=Pelotomaculum propionicicum TaxID=258475 RepID=A0A4Y7RRQ6_9FIRM|nr:SLC13 family permease [Pelotomaculum propionicicum]TEB11694.1 Sodium-dependent dicarboxylate transporter SdcS [Pelotomaculum propionicicum]